MRRGQIGLDSLDGDIMSFQDFRRLMHRRLVRGNQQIKPVLCALLRQLEANAGGGACHHRQWAHFFGHL